MNDLRDLEARASRFPDSVDAAAHHRLAIHYSDRAATEADHRERLSLLKRSCFFIENAVHVGMSDPSVLRTYLAVLDETATIHPSPQAAFRISAAVRSRLGEAGGTVSQKVLAQAVGKVEADGASMLIGDPAQVITSESSDPTERMMAWMRTGARLGFTTGCDAEFKGEIRLIDAPEPVLDAHEVAAITGATSTIVVEVPSGRIVMSESFLMEPDGLLNEESWWEKSWHGALWLELPPGRYKACAYGFSCDEVDTLLCVLARTDDEPPNEPIAVVSVLY